MTDAPPVDLVARAEGLLGARVRDARRPAGGYTNAERWVLRFVDGRSAFAKGGVDAQTAEWLRAEHRFCRARDDDFVPRLLAADVDTALPLVLFEDLSAATWPPPWTPAQIAALGATLARVAANPPPPWLPSLEAARDSLSGWHTVARDPAPFLGLELVTAGWLDASLPVLLAAEAAVVLAGDALVHLDVRSDNVCFAGDRVVLVDWNGAARGSAMLDRTAGCRRCTRRAGRRRGSCARRATATPRCSPATSRRVPACR